jgi:hypothetical protein
MVTALVLDKKAVMDNIIPFTGCCDSALSREENAVGRLLKTGSEHDKTRAGKMMAAVGKTENFSSQQLYVQVQLCTLLVLRNEY